MSFTIAATLSHHLTPLQYAFSRVSLSCVAQGDINIDQPWAIQVEARKKWEAWNDQKGKTQDEAKTQYIALANEAVKSYGVKSE
jgi:acyl-CoA-binding protein